MPNDDVPSLPERLSAGEVRASFVNLSDPSVPALYAAAGFDAVLIDEEHAGHGIATTRALIAAAHAAGILALVRLPEIRRATVQDALESGADGLVAPMVEWPQQASQLAEWSRYPPFGTRGFHPLTAASGHGRVPPSRHAERSNGRLLVAAQIETAKGLEVADEVAATPGIDLLFFGPGDFAMSLGAGPGDPRIEDGLSRLSKVAAAHGKWSGTFVAGEEDARRARAHGARLLVASADVALLAGAIRQLSTQLGVRP